MISICIATFNRPNQLANLIQVIVQEIERPTVQIEVVVCDNDINRSAESAVRAASINADIPIRYYCEPEQNISLARNKTVQEAKGQWVAFIDDDEKPSKKWLTSLFAAVQNYSADGAFGPVIPVLPKEIDPTIKNMGFKPPQHRISGMKLSMRDMACGNAIINAQTIKKLKGPFDKEFGLTGGEDTLLFGLLLHDYGCNFIWCSEAIVYELIPLSRCSRNWLIKRTFRSGQTFATIERKIYGNIRGMVRIVWALLVILCLFVLSPIFYLIGEHAFQSNLLQIIFKLGQLSSVLSWRYKEYEK